MTAEQRHIEEDRATDSFVVDHHVTGRPETPRILVTNDDGVEAPGLRLLARSLAREFDTVVVAPAGDMSGSGTGIGRFDPRSGVELERVPGEDVEAYRVSGPPGLAVLAAMLGAFGDPPDLVVSGINAGMNTGHSVIHSGTVGAALTARSLGAHGLAVSLAESDPWHWETAVDVARSAVHWILARTGVRLVLNVNVPAAPPEAVVGVHWADLDEFGHFHVAIADVPDSRLQFEVRGSGAGLDPGCDTALCLAGNVTLTLLSTVEPAAFPAEDATVVWEPGRPVGDPGVGAPPSAS